MDTSPTRRRQIVGDHVTVSRSTQFLIRPQNVCGHMTDTDEIEDTATFHAILDVADHRDDVEAFRNEYGDEKLAEALSATIDYLNGRLSRRMAATELEISNYAGIAITNEIEEVVRARYGDDPWLDTQLRGDALD